MIKIDFKNIRHRKLDKIELLSVSVFIVLYAILASLVSLNRYWQYNAFWYDLGIFDTTIWKLSQFKLPIITQLNPPVGKIVWADHFNPSVILLSPLYWITQKPEIILVAQAVVVGLSAFVAYKITLENITSKLARISLVVSYLGYVGLQNALYTDVHNIVFSLFPFMLTIWAIYQKKWNLYWIFLIITVGFQESLAALAVMLGIFLLFRKEKHIKIALGTIAFGLLYGITAAKILIPYLNGGNYFYQPALPRVWYEWITLFFNPANLKLRSIILTYATFGFLPLASLASLPLVVEHYLERFVLNTAATRWDLGFHYNALLSPIMFLSSVEVLIKIQANKIIKRIIPYWAGITILIVIFLHRFYLHGPLLLATHPVFYKDTQNAKFLDKFISQIPNKGLLMAQNNIAAHFTHGNTILLNKNYKQIKPEAIAVDIRGGQNGNNFFPLSERDVKLLVASVSSDLDYEKKEVTDTQLIFIRK